MDELFLLPTSPVAMPRAYWLDQPFLSSQLVIVEPSQTEWQRIDEAMHHDDSGFDMDILNALYLKSSLIIPHRRYNLLSGEFRSDNHETYLGSKETWHGREALEEAKFVHFSDFPVPKPWLQTSENVLEKHQPPCREINGTQDCSNREIWRWLYRDFSERRQVCSPHFKLF